MSTPFPMHDDPAAARDEQGIRQFAETMPIMVWMATPEGEIDYANELFFRHTGLPADTPLAESWQRALHPADLELFLAGWEDAVATGEDYRLEARVCSPQPGDYRWTRIIARPVRDARGGITRWFGTGTDIHQTRQLLENASELADTLSNTLESITDALLTVERDWRVTYANRQAERQLGIRRSGVSDRPTLDEVVPMAGPRFRRELERAMTENITVAFEERFEGPERWFDIRAYPSFKGLAIYLRNITEERRQREALRIDEERFRLLSEATDDVIWDWHIRDDRGWWSTDVAEGENANALRSAHSFETWAEKVHPEDGERVVEGLRAFLREGGETWSAEYRLRRGDGSFSPVFHRSTVIRDSSGAALRMISGMSDITERKAVEDKLREQATLLDKARDAIIVTDLRHRILFWNRSAERLYGWTAEEAVGASAEHLLDKGGGLFDAAAAKALAEGEWVGELEQTSKHGRGLVVEARWSLVRDESGEPRSIMSINTDITERKGLEQQFLRAQRMESIGTLAGGIAHDLNNVLAPILMSIDLLKLRRDDPEDNRILDTIETSARRGAEMVSQVLSFARGVEGRRIEVRLRHLIDDIIRISRETFPKNIVFHSRVEKELWTIEADPTQLHQVLLNLCVNARDAMPDGGRLSIEAENVLLDDERAARHLEAKPGPHVRLIVSDEGHGIPPGTLEKIFDPFFTTKDVGSGTGLGLSTTLAIVRSHGGFIDVESRPGHGTRFTISFPAHGGRTPAAPAAEAPRRLEGHGETVLLVDDETPVLEVASRTLESHGYHVLTASDGAEGLATFVDARESIDLVITDMAMPVMDGPTMIRSLRRLEPALPIISTSGFTPDEDATDTAGADLHLQKPYPADALLEAIEQVLQMRN